MLAWLQRRKTDRVAREALVKSDAADLIARYADEAYYVARDRDRGERGGAFIDANRPPRHWSAVKARIAALSDNEVGLDTATRHLRHR